MIHVGDDGECFMMGDNDGEVDEGPEHEVVLNGFDIGQYEVTQEEYETLMGMGSNPAHDFGVGDDYPVYYVSWFDAVEYCNALSVHEDLTPCYDLTTWSCNFGANGYRLPTEAEWEFAARGGVDWIDDYIYSGTTVNIGDFAWYQSNSGLLTHEVGNKEPNQLNIYDMSGNVREWCNDWYLSDYYQTSPVDNPTGPVSGSNRVTRGGYYDNLAYDCRVASRFPFGPGTTENDIIGFRVLRANIDENTAPNIPDNPYPTNGAIDVPVNTTLSWECSDPEGDTLTYDVYFGEIAELDSIHLVAEGITSASWEPDDLDYDTTHYWRLRVSDGYFRRLSPVWVFRTEIIVGSMIGVVCGNFEMGNHFEDPGDPDDELPVHEVVVNNSFIGQYEVTQKQYRAVMGYNPAHDFGVGDDYPVYYVSWFDAVEYCNALSVHETLSPCYNESDWSCDFSANGYRLPTEAEWEYAAREGVNWIDNYIYSGTTTDLGDYAWYQSNSGLLTHEVGSKDPNYLNIHDMSGNVREWCNDWYSSEYYQECYDLDPDNPVYNPTGPVSGSDRVTRGGYYGDPAANCRVSNRDIGDPEYAGCNIGFRILRPNNMWNQIPDIPDNPYPANGALDVELSPILTWECSDPDCDNLTYNVYFGLTSPIVSDPIVAGGLTDASWDTDDLDDDLDYDTLYYWMIRASDGVLSTDSTVWSFTTRGISGSMIFVQGYHFEMGNHFPTVEGGEDELPVHWVRPNDFYIGQYEVTQRDYGEVMVDHPIYDYGEGNNHPVYSVTWLDAVEYCNALSIREGLTQCYDLTTGSCNFGANGFRLPTEAEWEYAARGGMDGYWEDYIYSGTTTDLGDYAWYQLNSGLLTHEVGSKGPNQLNIYDMSGNVREWCNDWYSSEYYQECYDPYHPLAIVHNPTGPDSGDSRVTRGGHFDDPALNCRVSSRSFDDPIGVSNAFIGFRILKREPDE